MKRSALRLAFVLMLLALAWKGASADGSGYMVCEDGPHACSSFNHGSCTYNLNASTGCCETSGFCADFCCGEAAPPNSMVCDVGVYISCSSFNTGSCTFHYDPATNCCIRSSGTCANRCCA